MTGLIVAVALNWAVLACQAGQPYAQCRTMVAVVSVESSGCRDLVGDDGKSFGCSQVSVKAAREVGYKGRISVLAQNRKVNMDVGAARLNWCMNQMGSYRQGILCYNAGADGAQYTQRGKRRPLTPVEINCDPYVLKILSRLPAESSPTTPTHQDVGALGRECRAANLQALSSQKHEGDSGISLSTKPNRTGSPAASGGPVVSLATLVSPTPHRAARAALGPRREHLDKVYSPAKKPHQAR